MRIRLGIEPIAGLNSPFVLSEGLRDYLYDYGITHLFQEQNMDYGPNYQSYWYTAADLNMGGIWEEQWTEYIKVLTHRGIRLKENEDTLP